MRRIIPFNSKGSMLFALVFGVTSSHFKIMALAELSSILIMKFMLTQVIVFFYNVNQPCFD